MVPITISTADRPTENVESVLLDKPSTTVTLNNVKPETWVKVKYHILCMLQGSECSKCCLPSQVHGLMRRNM